MTIEAFERFDLTEDQEALIEKLEVFLESRSSCFLLKGYAGTGKTFMMTGITHHLTSIQRPFVLMAPTGRAAKVISKTTGAKASTIHKSIYLMNDLKEYKTKDIDGTETYKYYFDLAINDDDARTVYIVDESSMISNTYSEGEFFRFGSGHLLRDLLRYINMDNNDHQKQIIFIGDGAQLPPVNSRMSPALDAEHLLRSFGVDASEHELTQVVRQRADSGILRNASTIRGAIADTVYRELDIDIHSDDVRATTHDDLLRSYLQACNGKIGDDTIIVAHSNQKVKDYNDLVRIHFFPKNTCISKCDRVLVVHNNYRHEIPLLNGEFGCVVDVTDAVETRTVFLNKPEHGQRVNVPVELAFRDVVIRFHDIENHPHDIHCKINENLLNSNQRDLSSDETKALYVDFKKRHPNLKSGTPDFKEALLSDPYFNCLHIKYGYAVTCHKAQGGEWKNAFVDFGTNMGYFNEHYFRWVYTAITRAQECLYAINAPHFGILSPRRPPKVDHIKCKDNVLVLSAEVLDSNIAFGMPADAPFLRCCFCAVYDRIKDMGIKVDGIGHKQYCEHYDLSKDGRTAVVMIDYTANDVVAHVRYHPGSDDGFREELSAQLSDLEGKMIVSERPEDNVLSPDTRITEDVDYLKTFYDKIRTRAEEKGLQITSVTHPTRYHGKYLFKRAGLCAQVNYYFNGKGRLTRVDPDQAHTTSDHIMREVMDFAQ